MEPIDPTAKGTATVFIVCTTCESFIEVDVLEASSSEALSFNEDEGDDDNNKNANEAGRKRTQQRSYSGCDTGASCRFESTAAARSVTKMPTLGTIFSERYPAAVAETNASKAETEGESKESGKAWNEVTNPDKTVRGGIGRFVPNCRLNGGVGCQHRPLPGVE